MVYESKKSFDFDGFDKSFVFISAHNYYIYLIMDAINSLREALKFSPDNVPLRMHLAATLMQQMSYTEAEEEYKYILEISSGNFEAKCGLAKCAYDQKKFSIAYVLLEELSKSKSLDAEFHIMFAKILLEERQETEAGNQYKIAVGKNPSITDSELDKRFRIGAIDTNDESDEEEQNAFTSKLLVEKPKSNFNDVGGMEKVKEEIRLKIIHPITHSELYKAYGKKSGGGILLYGPPGCVKTHIARATAGEVNAKFINVGINDILDMWIGASEKNLHSIF
jgi:transitional endoplasmic reticulum ATPase